MLGVSGKNGETKEHPSPPRGRSVTDAALCKELETGSLFCGGFSGSDPKSWRTNEGRPSELEGKKENVKCIAISVVTVVEFLIVSGEIQLIFFSYELILRFF